MEQFFRDKTADKEGMGKGGEVKRLTVHNNENASSVLSHWHFHQLFIKIYSYT